MDATSAISIVANSEGQVAPDATITHARGSRVLMVDWIRGFLIVLMASSHAIALCAVAPDSFYMSHYWLPRGWATEGFITVSGLTAALAYDWEGNARKAIRGVRRRGAQLLVLMFISNVILLISKYVTIHELGRIAKLDWWFGLLTGRTEYSISGILLPTSIFLLLLPGINYCRQRWGFLALAIVSLVLAFTIRFAAAEWLQGTLIYGLTHFGAGFPILPFVATGMLGFVAGIAWKSFGRQKVMYPLLPIVLLVPANQIAHSNFILAAILPASRVLLLLVLGWSLTQLSAVQLSDNLLSLIGRYALFCFLGHRIIMHASIIIGRGLHISSPGWLYAWCMIGTFALLGLVCCFRMHSESFDYACRRVWL